MNTMQFQAAFLERATLPKGDDAMRLVSDYMKSRTDSISQARGLGVGKNGLSELSTKLSRAFVRRWMMLRYAALDLSFAERPWWLKIERNENVNTIVVASDVELIDEVDPVVTLIAKVNRFFRVKQTAIGLAYENDADDWTDRMSDAQQKAGTFQHGQRNKFNYRSADVVVNAALPDGLGEHHIDLVRGALGHFHHAVAVCYSRGVDLVKEMDMRRGYRSDDPFVEIIWAPSMESLTITANPPRPAGDPAIVFTLGKASFLLDFYDTPDETPIEHLIREFSEGKIR